MNLWKNTPGECQSVPTVTPFVPQTQKGKGAVVILPGGSYRGLAQHEGPGYAEFFAAHGLCAFAVEYRVAPHRFPLELIDARRALRWVRSHAQEYGIDKDKIAIMGSSAGGHLAALCASYTAPLPYEDLDEIDREDSRPNAQILCYPVIVGPENAEACHRGSYRNLIGENNNRAAEAALDPSRLANPQSPPAFLWHTDADQGVSVLNSYAYATALHRQGVPTELHVFPQGRHGLGLARELPHTAQWSGLLLNWLKDLGWLE